MDRKGEGDDPCRQFPGTDQHNGIRIGRLNTPATDGKETPEARRGEGGEEKQAKPFKKSVEERIGQIAIRLIQRCAQDGSPGFAERSSATG